MRARPEAARVEGNFATGMLSRTKSSPQHHGDFAVGIRSRVHGVLGRGDFAVGLRAAEG
jgi:hypothetical protein